MKSIYFLALTLFLLSCKDKPTVLQSETSQSIPQLSESKSSDNSTQNLETSAHQILAKEVKHTEKYTYILAKEGEQEFWVAVPRQEIKVNTEYLYRDALLKTNFYSQEFNKNFDKIYLVSSIIAANNHPGGSTSDVESEITKVNSSPDPSAISLKSLFDSKTKFAGKTITVTGKCVKANYNIMGRNWYHIQDNTKSDGKNLDLTITSNDQINVGEMVNFAGTIALNKDFGSGYKYEIIMEQATKK